MSVWDSNFFGCIRDFEETPKKVDESYSLNFFL